ncbi:proline-serine-threonine phosphatase-interacting protein 1-like [Cynoglossus semilaevis]|uniref:Proline-serine-threonine phosphatase interacting protein 1b n=1 Tax=Cynoglossus semilaevis TaxID=244447 RepID=A0A3P8VY02_CYNSE|nr:proline-serine-threonine phosphatase-interacting protein 1-like [Cynoglossus semilaevis]
MALQGFKDAFWGSDFTCHAGYDALIHRLRDGRQMCKDVEELVKMRALAEERYGKELVTIARKAGGQTEISTLRTSFDQLKSRIEIIGNFHIQLSDILKEEVKKIETFRERQREHRKKFESIMEKVQKQKVTLFKKTTDSKRNYELRCKEADEAEEAIVTSKNIEKTRQKARTCRQAANEAENLFLNNTVQLESVRQDWEGTHRSTCEVFQQMEEDRIGMLRCALWDHCNHFSLQCIKDDEFYEDVRKHLELCDITIDNNFFMETKSTGSRPHGPFLFERYYKTDATAQRNGQAHVAHEGHNTVRCPEVRPRNSAAMSPESPPNSPSSVTSFGDFELSEAGYTPLTHHQRDTSLATFTADEERYLVLYDFWGREDDELSVRKGETVQVLERGDDGWWSVEKNGQVGMVPGNYLGKT